MQKKYSFPCGCSFDVLAEGQDGQPPLLDYRSDQPPTYSCPATWALLAEGLTTAVFQLETNLGKKWTRRLRPECVDHVIALLSLLRPGCLSAVDERGVSMTEHYCRRRLGEEDVDGLHPVIDQVLEPTYNILCYQEQAMLISRELCGFDLLEVEALRKCVTADTMFVSKTRGWISIKRLLAEGYDDDLFLVMNGRGEQCWKRLEKIWATGMQGVRRVQSFSGHTVWATKYHQFLTSAGWKARMRLAEDDRLVAARYTPYDGEDRIIPALAFVIAGLATEGHLPDNRNQGHFTNFDPQMMSWYCEAFREVFGEDPPMSSDGRVARLVSRHTAILKCHMRAGLSAVKCLPDEMMGMTLETTRQFLSFMLAAEGGVCASGAFEFSSKSEKMARQVQLLLLRFRVRALLRPKEVNGYGTYYVLTITTREDQQHMLMELTCRWPDHKKVALEDIINGKSDKNYTTDTFPTHLTRSMLDQYPFVGRKESGTLFTAPVSRNRFARAAKATGDQEWATLADGHHWYDPVLSTDEKKNSAAVYDFTVEGGDTPYIVANGLVIHNSIGKKDERKLAEVGKNFVEKGEALGKAPREIIEHMWDIMRKSGRYLFNLSHAASYGYRTYQEAYAKTHFPLAFYAAKLQCAHATNDKQEDIRLLTEDARRACVEVRGPDLRTLEPHFFVDGDGVRCGVADVKGVGEKSFSKLADLARRLEAEKGRPLGSWPWPEVLFDLLVPTNKVVSQALIESGCLDWLGRPRKAMLAEYESALRLKDGECRWCLAHHQEATDLPSLYRLLARPKKEGGGVHTAARIPVLREEARLLENPLHPLVDTAHWVSAREEDLLGVALTRSRVDGYDTADADATCKEVQGGRRGQVTLGVEVVRVGEHLTKKKEKMAFLTVRDPTSSLDLVCFPDAYREFRALLRRGNAVLVRAERESKPGSPYDSVIVRHVRQAVPAR